MSGWRPPLEPTARGWVVSAAALTAAGAALVNPGITTNLLAATLLALVAASLLVASVSLAGLSVVRGYAGDASVGETVHHPLLVENRLRFTRQTIVARELLPFAETPNLNVLVPALAAREVREIPRPVPVRRRGVFELGTVFLLGGDPAGLFRRRRRFHLPDTVTVYPAVTRLSWMPIRIKRLVRPSAIGRPVGIPGAGHEFFGVREYNPSDGVRFIHWKASARHGKLMTREFEANSLLMIGILLDVNRASVGDDYFDNNFEYLVQVAASIVDYLSSMYCHLLFVTADAAGGGLVTCRGNAGAVRGRVMETLAALKPSATRFDDLVEEPVGNLPANSILYCLTMAEPPSGSECFGHLLDRGVDIRWIMAPREYFPSAEPRIALSSRWIRDDFVERFGFSPQVVRKGMNIATVLAQEN